MGLANFLGYLLNLLNTVLIPLLFVLAFVTTIWGIYQYFFLGWKDGKDREKGKKMVVYSLIGFFFMFSFWGIVQLLLDSTGFERSGRPELPTLFDHPAANSGSRNTQSPGFNNLDSGARQNTQVDPIVPNTPPPIDSGPDWDFYCNQQPTPPGC